MKKFFTLFTIYIAAGCCFAVMGGRGYSLSLGNIYGGENVLQTSSSGDRDTPIIINQRNQTSNMETSTSNTLAGGVALFPNPANNVIHLSCDKADAITSIIIFDATGQAVISRSTQGAQEIVDITSLPRGLYFVKISTIRTGECMKRLVKL